MSFATSCASTSTLGGFTSKCKNSLACRNSRPANVSAAHCRRLRANAGSTLLPPAAAAVSSVVSSLSARFKSRGSSGISITISRFTLSGRRHTTFQRTASNGTMFGCRRYCCASTSARFSGFSTLFRRRLIVNEFHRHAFQVVAHPCHTCPKLPKPSALVPTSVTSPTRVPAANLPSITSGSSSLYGALLSPRLDVGFDNDVRDGDGDV